jgi:acyl-ACP thioesterase
MKTPAFQLAWHEEFRIRNYEVGPSGGITVQSLFHYLIETAGNHAKHLGVSMTDLFAQGQTWVLSRLHLRVQRYPAWPTTIRVDTWPSGRQTLFALRDFRLTDTEGQEVGTATSSWMIIDVKRRRPVKIPEIYEDFINHEKGRALASDFARLPALERPDVERQFTIRLSDLDINQHVNAVRYLDLALESVPLPIQHSAMLTDLEIDYRAESVYGDSVTARCQVETEGTDNRVIHSLSQQETGKELTSLVTMWRATHPAAG